MKIPEYENLTGLPSTTDIISFQNKDAFSYYSEGGRLRGSIVHYLCELYLNGNYVIETAIDNDILPYFLSFKTWIELMIKDIILVEKRLVDKSGLFCGKLDFVAKLKGESENTLIDIKTSTAKNEKSWKLQLTSYKYLAENNGIPIKRYGALRVRRDGKLAFFDEFNDYEDNLKIFGNILNKYYKENIKIGVDNYE